MGVASGCGEQEVGVASGSGWNLWVWLLGVVVRRYIDFLIQLIPTPLVSVLFLQQHPYFLKMFFCIVQSPVHTYCNTLCIVLYSHQSIHTAILSVLYCIVTSPYILQYSLYCIV